RPAAKGRQDLSHQAAPRRQVRKETRRRLPEGQELVGRRPQASEEEIGRHADLRSTHMRKSLLAVAALVGLAALPLTAQTPATPYRLIFDPNNDVIQHDKDATGREGLFITVYFAVKRDDTVPLDPGAVYKVIIEEEGQKRMEVDIARPKIVTEELALVLTMDT